MNHEMAVESNLNPELRQRLNENITVSQWKKLILKRGGWGREICIKNCWRDCGDIHRSRTDTNVRLPESCQNDEETIWRNLKKNESTDTPHDPSSRFRGKLRLSIFRRSTKCILQPNICYSAPHCCILQSWVRGVSPQTFCEYFSWNVTQGVNSSGLHWKHRFRVGKDRPILVVEYDSILEWVSKFTI